MNTRLLSLLLIAAILFTVSPIVVHSTYNEVFVSGEFDQNGLLNCHDLIGMKSYIKSNDLDLHYDIHKVDFDNDEKLTALDVIEVRKCLMFDHLVYNNISLNLDDENEDMELAKIKVSNYHNKNIAYVPMLQLFESLGANIERNKVNEPRTITFMDKTYYVKKDPGGMWYIKTADASSYEDYYLIPLPGDTYYYCEYINEDIVVDHFDLNIFLETMGLEISIVNAEIPKATLRIIE